MNYRIVRFGELLSCYGYTFYVFDSEKMCDFNEKLS